MKNRRVPYGYSYEKGVITIHPQESTIVLEISRAYLEGKSLLKIGEWLNKRQIEYMPGITGWNKARLKRIIEDERYIGRETYPVILDKETHNEMQRIKNCRNTQKNTDRQIDILQITPPIKCPICGTKMNRKLDIQCKSMRRWTCENRNCRLVIKLPDKDFLDALSSLLNMIRTTPEIISQPTDVKSEPSIEVRRLNNEIERLLDSPQIDREALRKKMMECFSQKYKEINSPTYTTRKLQKEFETSDPSDYIRTLNNTVSEIILYADMTVGIVLLNGQLIRKEETT